MANKQVPKIKTILTVAKKELTDHLRDKRTATMIFLLSIAMGPIILMGLGYFIGSIEAKAEKKEIYVSGKQHAPELVNFLQRQDMKLLDPKPDFRELIKQGNHDAVMVIPADFGEKFLTGEAKVELVYDDTRQSSSGASVGALRRVMRAFNAEVSAQRLIARGVAPSVLRPVDVQDTNLGTAAQRAAGLLFIIPWITLIGCVTGCTAMAVDLAAGERERGSLEPLLMTPIGRDALVMGKGVAVSIYSLGIAVLTLIGFALTLKYGNLPAIGSVLSLSAAQYGMFFLMLLTFAPAMAAIQMLLATYGRNFKEGQTYATYAIQLVAILPAVAMFAQLKDATWQLFVPVLAQLMVITRLLRGETTDLIHFLLPAAVNAAIFVVAMVLIAQLLRQEKIIFGRA
ncbi:MAG: ABC transporter permease [Rhodocyclaceae bacterium]|nr:ABC transporter permease [Rhodocyclaceae bacterium]MCA3024741.1 ABC transporter permease [Rhodocyclaceae bacterium]MCA3032695.1 ABC transporter permease [Rhodocyclaceae bacterium]MCA3037784.1 ABC transporter permease [Rhodocyclaceae bacterium]MCA3046620.1 ABC transporter permease [Rhodocyclaceae bacterium]